MHDVHREHGIEADHVCAQAQEWHADAPGASAHIQKILPFGAMKFNSAGMP